MILIHGTALDTVSFQTGLFHLIVDHLPHRLTVDTVDINGGSFCLRSGPRLGNPYQCRCFNDEVIHLAVLTRLVSDELMPIPVGQQPIEQEITRVQRYYDPLKRSKIALAVMGRSKMDDDVILKFSLEDLCSAFAFFAEAKRSEQSYIFDGALHLTDPVEA